MLGNGFHILKSLTVTKRLVQYDKTEDTRHRMEVCANHSGITRKLFVDRTKGSVRVCLTGVVLICAIVVNSVDTVAIPSTLVLFLLTAFGIGFLISVIFLHPFRVLGLCPIATLMISISILASCLNGVWQSWPLIILSFGSGIPFGVAVRYEYTFNTKGGPATMLIWDRVIVIVLVTAILVALFIPPQYSLSKVTALGTGWWGLCILAILLLLHTWIRLFRPLFELCVELAMWRGYRISTRGTGIKQLPLRGPVLVIANHACWWDPLFLAKILPRPVTPLMTSSFYDKWFLKPLMVYVFQAIRVADVHIRREAPEIQQAIQALDKGKCVVIFPEGYLRRKEEMPLRRFGRGVWEILKARPETPVVACWIEGSWGSYASYWNGPPTKNKRVASHHPIAIAVSPALTVPSEVLLQHLQTRISLMNEVIKARNTLDLPALPYFVLIGNEDSERS